MVRQVPIELGVDSDGPTSCPLAAILLPFLTLLGEDGKEDDIGEDRG